MLRAVDIFYIICVCQSAGCVFVLSISKFGRVSALYLLNSELFRRGKEKRGKVKKQKKQKKPEVSIV